MAPANLSFDDMMNIPLDSSPLKAPSPRSSTATGSPVPSRPESPSPLATLPTQRKRTAEDMSQFASEVSRKHKLAKVDNDDLTKFAKLGRDEKMIFIAGQLLSLGHHQRLLQPVEADWTLPKRLQGKIESKAADLLIDSSIPAYRDDKIGPSKLLMDLVVLNPGWGFTLEVQGEKSAIDARNIIKTAISGSLGSDPIVEGIKLRPGALNIVVLATSILNKLKIKTTKVDLRLCGRIAVLRKLISENNDNKYWGDVDTKLANVREIYPDPKKQSRFLKKAMLDPDLEVYGIVDLNSLNPGPTVPDIPIAGPSTVSQAADGDSDDDANH
ncbi:hypothetical protein C8R44DRAFT_988398 [Mycena epipterygia]|nr:hypothetical protein C8R44DRAFT_988398 [Mycena epipterygia]